MKPHLTFAFGLILAVVASYSVRAQGPTNFPMVGLTKGQTLQINLVSYPPSPCSNTIRLGFQNSKGAAVGPTMTVTPQQLPAGQATSLSYSPAIASEKRLELLPTVTSAAAPVGEGCVASVEVITAGATSVLVPGATGYPPILSSGCWA